MFDNTVKLALYVIDVLDDTLHSAKLALSIKSAIYILDVLVDGFAIIPVVLLSDLNIAINPVLAIISIIALLVLYTPVNFAPPVKFKLCVTVFFNVKTLFVLDEVVIVGDSFTLPPPIISNVITLSVFNRFSI